MEEIIRGKINAELHCDIEGAFGGSQNVYAILSDEIGHLEEELKELKEELEEFEERDKRIKEEIERHREQMRNWEPRLFRRDADRYGERTDPKP